jgi:hypothetical protein
MRVRYILLLLAAGLYFAYVRNAEIAAYLIVFACIIAYGLRKIEGELRSMRLNTRGPAPAIQEEMSLQERLRHELRQLVEGWDAPEDPFTDKIILLLNEMDGRGVSAQPTLHGYPVRRAPDATFVTPERVETFDPKHMLAAETIRTKMAERLE